MKKILLSITALALASSTALAGQYLNLPGDHTVSQPIKNVFMTSPKTITIASTATNSTFSAPTIAVGKNNVKGIVANSSLATETLSVRHKSSVAGSTLTTETLSVGGASHVTNSTLAAKDFFVDGASFLTNTMLTAKTLSVSGASHVTNVMVTAKFFYISGSNMVNGMAMTGTFCYDKKKPSKLSNMLILANNSNVSAQTLKDAGAISMIKTYSDPNSGCPSSSN